MNETELRGLLPNQATNMSYLRTSLERLSRNITLKRQFSIAFRQTPLIVSPGVALGYWKPGLDRHDPMLLNIVKQFIKAG